MSTNLSCGSDDSPPAERAGAASCDLVRPPPSSGRLSVDGTAFRDELGRHVLLRGVNGGGRSKFAPFVPFSFDGTAAGFESSLAVYMNLLASWGINFVRMPFTWEAIEPQEGIVDEVYLTRYGQMVDAAWSRGIRVLVDFHQDVYASPFNGDGFPLWTLGDIPHGPPMYDGPESEWVLQYFDGEGPVARAFDRLWKNEDGLLDKLEAMWRLMARRFGSHPGVMGFEIINEPGPGTESTAAFASETLPRLLERLGEAIREEAPGAVLVGGGPALDALVPPQMGNPSLSAFVYAPHFYHAQVTLGGPYDDQSGTLGRLRMTLERGAGWERPTLLGEFGASYDSPDLMPFLRDVYAELDRVLASASIWEASTSPEEWNHEELRLLHADGSERATLAEAIRAYPRAVDGTIDAFSWDPAGKRFSLAVVDSGATVSEVYVPPRYVGTSPRITTEGACYAFSPESGLLLLRGTEGASWSVEVAPD